MKPFSGTRWRSKRDTRLVFDPVKNRHYSEVVDYLKDQRSAEEKRWKKQDVRDRKRCQRERDREGMSRVTSRPPDPVPDPEIKN